MKQRLKYIGVTLCAVMIPLTIYLWIHSTQGWLDGITIAPTSQILFEIRSVKGQILLGYEKFPQGDVPISGVWTKPFEPISEFRHIFPPPTLSTLQDDVDHASVFYIGFPHWLLLILFATPPSLWLHARYKERREKKLFEEAVAAKRAEIQQSFRRNQPPSVNGTQ